MQNIFRAFTSIAYKTIKDKVSKLKQSENNQWMLFKDISNQLLFIEKPKQTIYFKLQKMYSN